eukprot:PhM_4_TR5357/c0_g1_i1/m.88458
MSFKTLRFVTSRMIKHVELPNDSHNQRHRKVAVVFLFGVGLLNAPCCIYAAGKAIWSSDLSALFLVIGLFVASLTYYALYVNLRLTKQVSDRGLSALSLSIFVLLLSFRAAYPACAVEFFSLVALIIHSFMKVSLACCQSCMVPLSQSVLLHVCSKRMGRTSPRLGPMNPTTHHSPSEFTSNLSSFCASCSCGL